MTSREPAAELPDCFAGRVTRLHFPAFSAANGQLTPFDLSAIPLSVQRAFVVEAPDGAFRGGHAHPDGTELLVRLAGRIEVDVQFDGVLASVTLDATSNALLIASPVWSRQRYHGNGAQLLVFCDTPYAPDRYLYDGLIPPGSAVTAP